MLLSLIKPISLAPPAYTSTNNSYNKPYYHTGVDSVCFRSNTPYTEKITKFPDLKQYAIKGCEEYYCGPVSLANGIAYLRQDGYPNLLRTKSNMETIDMLAIYLKTNRRGTTTNNLCLGIKNAIKDSGYNYKSIEYKGNRAVNREFSKGDLAPDLEWIKSSVEKKGIVLLNIGIYNQKDGVYQRKWGHWVTVVGHGYDGKNRNPNALIIQDPYKKAKENSYFTLEKMNEGILIPSDKDDERTLNQNAQDYYKITSKIPYLQKDEISVVNGVIALEM